MADHSREALLGFMDYMGNKGLMAKATVASRKAAAGKILGILDESEAADVSSLNLDEVVDRFQNLHGRKYTPQSLSAYKSRTRAAIDDFTAYLANPLAFKPSVQSRDRTKIKNGGQAAKADTIPPEPRSEHAPRPTQSPMVSNSILPIPLRVDLTVYIQGLPFDLTEREALKIANVVQAMAPKDI